MKKSSSPDGRKGRPLAVFKPSGNIRLLDFLFTCYPDTGRNSVKALLSNGSVYVNGVGTTRYDHALHAESIVEVRKSTRVRETRFRGIHIVFEDESIVVILKEEGILSISDGKTTNATAYSMLYDHVKAGEPGSRIFIVHRLDRDTSGLMLFAKEYEVKQAFQNDWKNMVTERTYVAVVEGIIRNDSGVLRSMIAEDKNLRMHETTDGNRGREAVTRYRTLLRGNGYSLLELELETGRKNQIRVQLAEIGHPVAGDGKYGSRSNPIRRLALHARLLGFTHPVSGKKLRFETPVPESFRRLCAAETH